MPPPRPLSLLVERKGGKSAGQGGLQAVPFAEWVAVPLDNPPEKYKWVPLIACALKITACSPQGGLISLPFGDRACQRHATPVN